MGRLAGGPVILVLVGLGCGAELPLGKDLAKGVGMEPSAGKDDVSPSASPSTNQPIPLAVDQLNAWAIALDDDFVYWTNNVNSPGGHVLRCAKTGCPQGPTLIASGLGYPWSIAVDSFFVYWTNREDGTVAKCPVGSTCG